MLYQQARLVVFIELTNWAQQRAVGVASTPYIWVAVWTFQTNLSDTKTFVVSSYPGCRKMDLWMVMYLWFSEVQDVLYYSFALVSKKMGWKGCSNSIQKTFRNDLTVKKFNLNSAIFTCLLFSAGVKIFLSFTLMAWCNEWIHCFPTEWLSCCFICLVVNATNYEDF